MQVKSFHNKNVDKSREIESLTAKVTELTKQLAEKDKQLENAKRDVKRNQNSTREAKKQASKATERNKNDTAQLRATIYSLLEKYGGLSRLTIFNKAWHAKNPDAC